MNALVTGAGGFIGGHVVRSLLDQGRAVKAVDIKPLSRWYQLHPDAWNVVADCRLVEDCREIVGAGVDEVYNFASDMGGMAFIETHKTECMLSVLINTHLLMAASEAEVGRYLFASSACVYPSYRQDRYDVEPLKEEHAYPADPEDGYGWEKLFSERMCRHFHEERGLETRIARYHNIYGPRGSWKGGREKAPAAICRKVATAELTGVPEIEIWGSGEQRRSYTYIEDCVHGTELIMRGDHSAPVNLGSSEMVSVNELVSIVEEIAGITLKRNYVPGPLGVHGRNSDNDLIQRTYGWQPPTRLRDGLATTYAWIHDQVARELSP